MASAFSLYSSSPPTGMIASPRSIPIFVASASEAEQGRRISGSQRSSRQSSGGLSSLFTSSTSALHEISETRNGSGHFPACEPSTILHSSSLQIQSRMDSSDQLRGTDSSVPSSSSWKSRDRTGSFSASHGIPRSFSAIKNGSVLRDGAGMMMSEGSLPLARRPSSNEARRPTFIASAEPRRPLMRRVGFQVESSRPSSQELQVAESANALGAEQGLLSTLSQGNKAAFLHDSSVVVCGSPTKSVASSSDSGSDDHTECSSSLQQPSSLEQARSQFARLFESESAAGSPPDLVSGQQFHHQSAPTSMPSLLSGKAPAIKTDAEILADAQAQHAIFYDPLIKFVFNIAAGAHAGQFRKDGQPLITHCVQTALILARTGADKQVVAAGLLHDVLDDSPMSEPQLRELFDSEICDMVVGVGKLSSLSQLSRDNARLLGPAETDRLRTMLLAMADVRVVLIKLADRLHNLRTLDALPHAKQHRMAAESVEVFAPLANRLGIWAWKAEMEDRCFRCLYPEEYGSLAKELGLNRSSVAGSDGDVSESNDACTSGDAVAGHTDAQDQGVLEAIRQLDEALRDAGVKFQDLSGRPKNLYSIHKKMVKKGRSVDQIFDVRGLRIICPDIQSCYAALRVVQGLWTCRGDRHFKDYVKKPKANGYQSIHTVVADESGHSLEIQIRTAEMHHAAEFGVAAHWRYKETGGSSGEAEGGVNHSRAVLQKVEWARFVLSWSNELGDTKIRLSTHGRGAQGTCSGRKHSSSVEGGACTEHGMCPFPTHLDSCRYAALAPLGGGFGTPENGEEANAPASPPWSFSFPSGSIPASSSQQQSHEDEPVLIIVVDDDRMTVKEVPAGSTVADVVREHKAEHLSKYPVRCRIRPLLNQEVVVAAAAGSPFPLHPPSVLQTGDVLEIAVEEEEDEMLVMIPHGEDEEDFPAMFCSSSSAINDSLPSPLPQHAAHSAACGWADDSMGVMSPMAFEQERLQSWFSGGRGGKGAGGKRVSGTQVPAAASAGKWQMEGLGGVNVGMSRKCHSMEVLS